MLYINAHSGAGGYLKISFYKGIFSLRGGSAYSVMIGRFSAVYTVDRLALPVAGLIQGAVLLLDYLLIYLLNGWLKPEPQIIVLFIVIFIAVFAAIWFIIYKVTQRQISRLNKEIINN